MAGDPLPATPGTVPPVSARRSTDPLRRWHPDLQCDARSTWGHGWSAARPGCLWRNSCAATRGRSGARATPKVGGEATPERLVASGARREMLDIRVHAPVALHALGLLRPLGEPRGQG